MSRGVLNVNAVGVVLICAAGRFAWRIGEAGNNTKYVNRVQSRFYVAQFLYDRSEQRVGQPVFTNSCQAYFTGILSGGRG